MRLGFLTACLPRLELEEIAAWAEANGFDALEVAAWRRTGDRDFTASHIDAANFGPADAEAVRALFERHNLTLSSLAYYDNNLHPDPDDAQGGHRQSSDTADLP